MKVFCGLTVVIGLKEHLNQTETAPREVQQHVPDTPSLCALPAVVHVRLKSNSQLFTVSVKYVI